MARINNLTNFLTDIATAIKSKTGRNTKITPSNFDTEILSIASDLGNKSVSITSNGTNTYQATNDNLDGYSQVTVTTNVQPSLQSKTVTPTTSSQTITADNEYYGLSQVKINQVDNSIDSNIKASNIKKNVSILGVTGTYDNASTLTTKTITSNGIYNASSDNADGYSQVTVATEPNLQQKSVSPTTSSQTITPDSSYDGLSQVTVSAIQTETKTVTPTTSNQTVTPTSNKYLTQVTVNGVTNTIDSNIIAGNIKKDVSILGVTGTYEGSGSSANLGTKTITENGTYNASSDNVDGYSSVTVNVSSSLPTITDARYLCAYNRSSLYDELLAMCSGITSVAYMFNYANNVVNIDFTKLNRFSITSFNNIFANSQFQNIDLRGVDMSNVTTLENMCYWCSSLKTLNLSNCNTSNVTRIYHMLYYCKKLEELDISNFDFTNVTYYSGAFTNCGTDNATPTTVYVKDATAQQWILNLSSSDRPSDWSTDNVIIKGS